MTRRTFLLSVVGLSLAASLQAARPTDVAAAFPACTEADCVAPPRPPDAVLAGYRRPAEIPYPEENPFSEAKYALGMSLFFDPVLSRSGRTSCASCHQAGLAWGDGRALGIGDTGEAQPLRSPTLLNIAWLDVLGWTGRFPSLESVAYVPITTRTNMGLDEETVIVRLSAQASYRVAFAAAFGDGAITRPRVEDALATFERGIVSAPGAFDRWVEGNDGAISAAAKRGFDLFNGRAGCANCHSGWAFTDGSFHDIGTATGEDRGRGVAFPSSVKLQYAFKTPTLRDVARRAPYMHDGSVPTLAAVIDLYDRGGIDRPSRAVHIKPLHLSPGDKADLIAFLQALSSDPPEISAPESRLGVQTAQLPVPERTLIRPENRENSADP